MATKETTTPGQSGQHGAPASGGWTVTTPGPNDRLAGLSLKDAVGLAKYMKDAYGIEAAAQPVLTGPGLDHLSDSAEVRVMAHAAPLAAEIAAFDRDLPQLLTTDLGRFSVYVGTERVGTFATESEAFDAGYDRTQFQRPFLMRRVEPNHEGTASSWQMGRPIA